LEDRRGYGGDCGGTQFNPAGRSDNNRTMSEHIICFVVPAIIALVGTVFTGLVAYFMFRHKTHAEAVTR
jgi:hypothetical protein